MCSAPKIDAPRPVTARQAPRLPDTEQITSQSDDLLRRRGTLASMVFSRGNLMAPADTIGSGAKPTLGA